MYNSTYAVLGKNGIIMRREDIELIYVLITVYIVVFTITTSQG
jgi:hypothetical protein